MIPEIKQLVRPHVLNLVPYSSARDEYKGSYGVFLDANENPLGSVSGGTYNRYPDPYQKQLKAQLAALKKVDPTCIFLGNGSDEIIDLLYRVFCEPKKDQVMTFPPTFGMYEASAGINQVEILPVPLGADFQLDLEAIDKAASNSLKLTFVCSPNNPTGNLMRRGDIISLLDRQAGLVILDEAYIDFAEECTCLDLLADYPRLVILQTFSKAWGMANLRIGMAFAHPDLISMLNKVKMPYNVNGLSQDLALKALENVSTRDEMIQTLLAEKAYMKAELQKLPMVKTIYASDANFLLVKMDEGNRRYQELIEKQVVVRNRSRVMQCEDCLRITIGLRSENEELLRKLAEL